MSSSYLPNGGGAAILEAAMRDTTHEIPTLCPRFHRASELIGRRWSGAIIFVLLKARCRFATLRAAIPEITDRMLSDRLQELEAAGVVSRTVVPETPVRVEYGLTEKGAALAKAIAEISRWADDWVEPGAAAPARKGGRAVKRPGRRAEAGARR